MTRRAAGSVFIAIAAFLHGIHYLAAAIFSSGVHSWNAGLFQAMLQYTAPGLNFWSKIALAAGVLYLLWAEVEAFQQKKG